MELGERGGGGAAGGAGAPRLASPAEKTRTVANEPGVREQL